MSKTALVLSEPRLIFVTREQLPFTLHFLTNELFSSCEFLDFPPVILDVIEVPNSNEIQITYAFRYEVEK